MKRRVVGAAVVALAGLAGSSALAAAPTSYMRPGRINKASLTSQGAQSNAGPATTVARRGISDISADGRYVTFTSDATNLVPGDTNLAADVLWRDRKRGRTLRASTSSTGEQARIVNPLYESSQGYSISANGRYVAFASQGINLVPGDTNLKQDAFVKDVFTGTTALESYLSGPTKLLDSMRLTSRVTGGR